MYAIKMACARSKAFFAGQDTTGKLHWSLIRTKAEPFPTKREAHQERRRLINDGYVNVTSTAVVKL